VTHRDALFDDGNDEQFKASNILFRKCDLHGGSWELTHQPDFGRCLLSAQAFGDFEDAVVSTSTFPAENDGGPSATLRHSLH
jgi:hypothetical protein